MFYRSLKQRRKSSLTCFLLRKRKCIVSLPAVAVGLKGDGEARGVLPFCNTHASMVKLRVEGLCSNWDEPRDPAASLADPTLWQALLSSGAQSGSLNRGRHDWRNGDRRRQILRQARRLGGRQTSVKTEIVSAIETAGYS
jgi:hypothetical protein